MYTNYSVFSVGQTVLVFSKYIIAVTCKALLSLGYIFSPTCLLYSCHIHLLVTPRISMIRYVIFFSIPAWVMGHTFMLSSKMHKITSVIGWAIVKWVYGAILCKMFITTAHTVSTFYRLPPCPIISIWATTSIPNW